MSSGSGVAIDLATNLQQSDGCRFDPRSVAIKSHILRLDSPQVFDQLILRLTSHEDARDPTRIHVVLVMGLRDVGHTDRVPLTQQYPADRIVVALRSPPLLVHLRRLTDWRRA